jgi:hypothetical protein
MIAKGSWGNNEPGEVIHRFHKRESCVFHSIHRLLTSLQEAFSRMGCDWRACSGSLGHGDPSEGRHNLASRGSVLEPMSIDTAETARI